MPFLPKRKYDAARCRFQIIFGGKTATMKRRRERGGALQVNRAYAMVTGVLVAALAFPHGASATPVGGQLAPQAGLSAVTPDTQQTPLSPVTPATPATPQTPETPSVPKERLGRWMWVDGRWWFMLEVGEWMRNDVVLIEGVPYAFDAAGWMQRGWCFIKGFWYYADASGVLQSGWRYLNGSWYYLHPGGAHLNPYAMHTEWLDLASEGRYYLRETGEMARGWQFIGDAWYYFGTSGAMATGWRLVDGRWYFFGESWSGTHGQMRIGLTVVDGHTFCLNTTSADLPVGAMVEGWVFDTDSHHYLYFYPGWGALARDTWIEGSYVDANGFWVPEGPQASE